MTSLQPSCAGRIGTQAVEPHPAELNRGLKGLGHNKSVPPCGRCPILGGISVRFWCHLDFRVVIARRVGQSSGSTQAALVSYLAFKGAKPGCDPCAGAGISSPG